MGLDSALMESQINIYSFVMARLRERRVPQRRIAADSGVPFSTLSKISQGVIKDPSVHHIQRLYDYFQRMEGGCACCNHQKAA